MVEFLDSLMPDYDDAVTDEVPQPAEQRKADQRKPEQRGQAGGQAAKRGHGGEQRVS